MNNPDNTSLCADVTIIGAGPAGLSAAVSAAHHGAKVIVIDNADQPGGQFWRHRPENIGPDDGSLHHGWSTYLRLRAQFDEGISDGRIRYFPFTAAIMTSRMPSGSLSITAAPSAPVGPLRSREPICIESATIILATGCFDRHIPIPGWTLPGVMAAGGIQAFAKAQGFLPGKRFVIAGTGPFLLSVAATVLQLGGQVAAICEANPLTGWVPQAHRALTVPEKMVEGLHYAALLARHRVPYLVNTPIESITPVQLGNGESIGPTKRHTLTVHTARHRFENIDCVGLGWGFTPQMELAIQLSIPTRIDIDGSTVGIVDENQETTVPGVFLAGELTGVGGAQLAVVEGKIAGKAAAQRAESARKAIAQQSENAKTAAGRRTDNAGTSATQRTENPGLQREKARPGLQPEIADSHLQPGANGPRLGPEIARPDRRDAFTRGRLSRFAQALHKAHPTPNTWVENAPGDTIICRCEDVTISAVRDACTALPDADARFVKGMTRVGMGPCQGRMCGFAVDCAVGAYNATGSGAANRPLAQPVPLGVLKKLATPPGASTNDDDPSEQDSTPDPS